MRYAVETRMTRRTSVANSLFPGGDSSRAGAGRVFRANPHLHACTAHDDANPSSHSHSYGRADSHPHACTVHDDANRGSHSHSYGHADIDARWHTHTYRHSHADTHASAHLRVVFRHIGC